MEANRLQRTSRGSSWLGTSSYSRESRTSRGSSWLGTSYSRKSRTSGPCTPPPPSPSAHRTGAMLTSSLPPARNGFWAEKCTRMPADRILYGHMSNQSTFNTLRFDKTLFRCSSKRKVSLNYFKFHLFIGRFQMTSWQ